MLIKKKPIIGTFWETKNEREEKRESERSRGGKRERKTRRRARVRAPEKDQIRAATLLSLGGHQIYLVRIRISFSGDIVTRAHG